MNGKGEKTNPNDAILLDSFDLSSLKNKFQAHEALSFAVSKAMDELPEFRLYLHQKLISDGVSFNELVLGSAKNDLIQNASLQSILNSYLSELTVFADEDNSLEALIKIDPLISISISDVHFRTSWDPNINTLPVISMNSNIEGNSFFYKGFSSRLDLNADEIYSLIVRSSAYSLLISKSDGSLSNGRPFESLTGMKFGECSELNNFIQSMDDYMGQNGKALVNILKLGSVLNNVCSISNPAPQSPDGPENMPECLRASWNKNYNSFEGMWLSDIAAFNLINNQKCAGGEEVFSFNFKWVFGNSPIGQTSHKVFSFFRNQVLNPGVLKYKEIPVFERIFGSIRIRVGTIRVSNGYLVAPYPEYMDIHMPVFSTTNVSDNNWQPNIQGRFVTVKIIEIDANQCDSQTVQTYLSEISHPLQFGVKDKASGTVQWNSSSTYSDTSTITAYGPLISLGLATFSYCDLYGSYAGYAYPDMVGKSDFMYIHLYEQKID